MLAGTVGAIASGIAGCLGGTEEVIGEVDRHWRLQTATEYDQNHHAPAAIDLEDGPVVAVPINDVSGSDGCAVVGVDATGEIRWRQPLIGGGCNPHAIADVGTGAFTDPAQPEFLVPMGNRNVVAYAAASGEQRFAEQLFETGGYGAPTVVDSPGGQRLVAASLNGHVVVVGPSGETDWATVLDDHVWAPPLVDRFTGDSTPEIAINHGREVGEIVLFDLAGEIQWRKRLPNYSVSWTCYESDNGRRILAATRDGDLIVIDGADGAEVGAYAVGPSVEVGPVVDGIAYAITADGSAVAVDADTGEQHWTTTVDADTRLTRSAYIASLEAIVVTSFDGVLALLDAATGDRLARRNLTGSTYQSPVVLETDPPTVLVFFGNGEFGSYGFNIDADQ